MHVLRGKEIKEKKRKEGRKRGTEWRKDGGKNGRKESPARISQFPWYKYSYVWVHAKSPQLCPTLRPYRLEPTRLLCPWDSPGRIMEFPCPPPGDLPNPGTEPTLLTSPALVGWIFTTSTTWEALAQFQPPLLKQVCKPLWLQWASMSELHILLWSKYFYFLQRTYHSLFYLLSYQSSLLDCKRIKADILSYSFPYMQYLLNK